MLLVVVEGPPWVVQLGSGPETGVGSESLELNLVVVEADVLLMLLVQEAAKIVLDIAIVQTNRQTVR